MGDSLYRKSLDVSVENRKKSRFLVDENLGTGATEYLRSQGWNVKDVREVGMAGHPIEDVFCYAYRENRILLTRDGAFLDDGRFPPYLNPGVVILTKDGNEEQALGKCLGMCLYLVGEFPDNYRGKKVIVSSNGTIRLINGFLASGPPPSGLLRESPATYLVPSLS